MTPASRSVSQDAIFRTLADPTRRGLFERLCRDGEQTVGALTEGAGISQPAVSKHLKVLREANLVEVRQDAQRRWYRLQAKPLIEIEAWLAPYRSFWSERLDALEAYLSAQEQEPS